MPLSLGCLKSWDAWLDYLCVPFYIRSPAITMKQMTTQHTWSKPHINAIQNLRSPAIRRVLCMSKHMRKAICCAVKICHIRILNIRSHKLFICPNSTVQDSYVLLITMTYLLVSLICEIAPLSHGTHRRNVAMTTSTPAYEVSGKL